MIPMTRREALKTATALVGGVLIAPGVLTGCAPESREAASEGLIPEDQALLEDIADTLLPHDRGLAGSQGGRRGRDDLPAPHRLPASGRATAGRKRVAGSCARLAATAAPPPSIR